MRYTELLIEAIECSGEAWADEYDLEDSKKIILGAINEKPEEHEIAKLIALIEPEENEYEETSPLKLYRKCLQRLKRKLRKDDELYE